MTLVMVWLKGEGDLLRGGREDCKNDWPSNGVTDGRLLEVLLHGNAPKVVVSRYRRGASHG